jgi:nucleoside-diphosphate-sugar epimerase
MQRILITGGTGFIGRHLVARLVGMGYEVHILARSEESLQKLGPLANAVEAHLGDLEDAASLKHSVDAAKADIVCHLAARTDLRRPQADLSDVRQALEVDVLGGLDFLRALAQAEKPPVLLLQAASLAEYGTAPLPYRETVREEPVSAYGLGRLMQTHLLQSLRDRLPFPAVMLRLALTYGRGQSESFLVPGLIETLLKGEPYAIKSGGVTRDLIHVDDVVDAFVACLERPDLAKDLSGEAINISTGRETAMADLGRMIERLIGVDGLVTIGDAPAAGGSARLVAAPDKARERLGWRAAIDLEDGLRQTIAWHRDGKPPIAPDAVDNRQALPAASAG